jgi:hypothetical protein
VKLNMHQGYYEGLSEPQYAGESMGGTPLRHLWHMGTMGTPLKLKSGPMEFMPRGGCSHLFPPTAAAASPPPAPLRSAPPTIPN